jgi:6-pyruvoyl-tetrahydropterin synthase
MGMVFDLGELDRILQEEVVSRLDGKHLNQDVPGLSDSGMLPTCEAIAVDVYRRVAARLPRGVTLERVRIMEDPTLHADCTGLG